jgi:DNA mismatch endonuclease (patch repair protein)
MMATVRSKNSKAEIALRRALHARGVRYRLHSADLEGRPDIVIRSSKLAIFVDGDMWHGNAWRVRGLSELADMFPTNTQWWVDKIQRTMERDVEVTQVLSANGWTVIRLWESDVLSSPDSAATRVIEQLRPSGAACRDTA